MNTANLDVAVMNYQEHIKELEWHISDLEMINESLRNEIDGLREALNDRILEEM